MMMSLYVCATTIQTRTTYYTHTVRPTYLLYLLTTLHTVYTNIHTVYTHTHTPSGILHVCSERWRLAARNLSRAWNTHTVYVNNIQTGNAVYILHSVYI